MAAWDVIFGKQTVEWYGFLDGIVGLGRQGAVVTWGQGWHVLGVKT